MTPETSLILRLTGELLKKLGSKTMRNTTKGRLPPEIERKLAGYRGNLQLWSYGDEDILALLAVAELMWERSIGPLSGKSEDELQMDFGVNAFSMSDTQSALARMEAVRKDVDLMRIRNEAVRDMARALEARSLLGGPLNASQIHLDRMASEQVRGQCARNLKALESIRRRLDTIILASEEARSAHEGRMWRE